MPTAKAGYFLKNGDKVPSVTTVLSRFKESGGLIHWAYKLGLEGKDYRAVRDEAAAAGTLAHDMIERRIRLQPELPYDPKVPEEIRMQAETALDSYDLFRKEMGDKLAIIVAEKSLVSETFGFGGTLDAMGMVDGKLCILDWKTSKSLHPEAVAQCAAYRMLWNENNPDQMVGNTAHLVRFSKTEVAFEHKPVVLEAGWRYFLALLAAYGDDKAMAAALKPPRKARAP